MTDCNITGGEFQPSRKSSGAGRLTRGAAIGLIGASVAVPRIALGQLTTLRIGASAAATNAEAHFAEQLGVFKQFGIASQETVVTRSNESLPGVIRGDLDIGCTSPQSIANAIIHGFPVRIIAGAAVYGGDPPPVQLFVKRSSTLRDPREFESATIGVQTLNDSQALGVLSWLQQHRVDTTKVKFVEIPFTAMAPAIDRNEVVAGCIVEPFASAHKDIIRAVPKVYDSLGYHWALVTWYAKEDWIQSNRALVKRFVDAMYATGRKVNANPSSIDEILSAYSKVPLDAVRTTPHPLWAQAREISQLEPQLRAAAEFKLTPRFVSYKEITGT